MELPGRRAKSAAGSGRGLPPVYATQNNYFHWGPPPDLVDVAIIIDPCGEEMMRAIIEAAELATIHDCDWCMPWRDDVSTWVATRPKVTLSATWPELRHYE